MVETKNKYSTLWTAHCKTQEEKDKFILSLKSKLAKNDIVFNRLVDILLSRLDNIETKETVLEDYENSSWSHKQAHRNGQKSELYTILKLLT